MVLAIDQGSYVAVFQEPRDRLGMLLSLISFPLSKQVILPKSTQRSLKYQFYDVYSLLTMLKIGQRLTDLVLD